jgi:hypothetical protein
LYEGISDQLAGNGEGTSEIDIPHGKRHGHSSEAADTFRGSGLAEPLGAEAGPANVAVVLPGAGQPAAASTSCGAYLAVAEGTADDSRPAFAAALTTSPALHALPPTRTFLNSGEVERLDQLFATDLEEGTSHFLPKAKRNQWSFGDEDGVNAVL